MPDLNTSDDGARTAVLEPAAATDAGPAIRTTGWRRHAGGLYRAVPGPLFGLILIVCVFSYLSPYFFTTRNIVDIFSQISEVGIMAVGSALVIITGGIDLSVGAVLAVSLMITAWLFRDYHVVFPVAMLAGLGVGAFIGFLNGILATYGRIQPFVATLATMSACSGIALFITNGSPITGFPDFFTALTSTHVFGIPLETIILISVYLVAAFWLRFRPGGRALYALGGNEEVARLSGLDVQRIKVGVYVIAGLLAALAGLIVGSRLDSAQPTAGLSDLLSVIAVVVIGGASLSGGSGGMLGTFIGLPIIGVLQNGMALINVSPDLQPVVIGMAIILAVMTDRRAR